MGATPTQRAVIGQFINGRNATDDFLQLASSMGGTVFGWIDSNGVLQGSLATGTPGGLLVNPPLASSLTPAIVTVGTAGSTSYSYQVIARKGILNMVTSNIVTIATGNATLTGTNYNSLSWSAVAGADSYDVYRVASSGTPATTGQLVANTTGLNFNDTGLAVINSTVFGNYFSQNGQTGISNGLVVGTSINNLTTFPISVSDGSTSLASFVGTGDSVVTVNLVAQEPGPFSAQLQGIQINIDGVTNAISSGTGISINTIAADFTGVEQQASIESATWFNIPTGHTNTSTQASQHNFITVYGGGSLGGAEGLIGLVQTCETDLLGTTVLVNPFRAEIVISNGVCTEATYYLVDGLSLVTGGTASNVYGFKANSNLSAAGTFSSAFYAVDQGTAAGHWAFYSAGSTPSLFGGKITSAGIVITAATPTTSSGQIGIGTTTASSATAGTNGDVPAQVVGYLEIDIAGTKFKMPYYNV